MTREQLQELWVRFLAGETLPVQDQRALLEAIIVDRVVFQDFLEDAVLDGMLRGMALGAAPTSGRRSRSSASPS